MSTREEITSSIVARLQQIKTIDDLKASKKTILDVMEESFTSALNELKEFVDNMETMPEDELQTNASKFFDDSYWDMPPEIETEMQRLMNLPGGEAYMDTFEPELDSMIGPIMSQFEIYGEKIRNKLFGGVIDAFEGAAQEMAGEMENIADGMKDFAGDEWEAEQSGGYNSEDPDSTELLYELYEAPTMAELNTEPLEQTLADELEYIHEELKILTDESFMEPNEEDIVRINEMGLKVKRILPEMEKEFARLAEGLDNADKAQAVHANLKDKFASKINDIISILPDTGADS